jgi:hypothetical protein
MNDQYSLPRQQRKNEGSSLEIPKVITTENPTHKEVNPQEFKLFGRYGENQSGQ